MSSQGVGMVTGSTRAIAILGYPVRHALSPVIHNAAFASAGLDYCYLAHEVRPEDIEQAVRGVMALDYAGITLTSPHKQSVMPLLDELTEEARAIGAVNTVANRDGRWVGTNTDATGFRRLLELNGLYRPGMKALMLGAGGAGRAGLYVLGQVAGEVVIFNRTVGKAEDLMASMAAFNRGGEWKALPMDAELLRAELEGADLLVNTTTVGMHPNVNACPLPEGVTVSSSCGVVDMIYMPPKTRLLELAERSGAKAVSGHEMLLYQAVDAFKFWTGVDPDVEAMDRALRAARHN